MRDVRTRGTGRSRLPVFGITVAFIVVLLLPTMPASADPWTPGERIGTIRGAEQWCGVPYDDPNLCPPDWPPGGARFNLDLLNWTPWANTGDDGRGGLGTGLGQFNFKGSYGGVDNLGVGVWCVPTPLIIFNYVFWIEFWELKEEGPANPAPPGAQGADVSFRCIALYIDKANSDYSNAIIRFDEVTWWVHNKTGGSDRGWIYLDHPASRTIKGMKVSVASGAYSHSLDICTPNSNPDSCVSWSRSGRADDRLPPEAAKLKMNVGEKNLEDALERLSDQNPSQSLRNR